MNKTELLELIANRENSRVEFKRDDIHHESLAKEMSALLNFEGGTIFLGVEDDRRITGLRKSREKVEEWVMEIARNNLQPEVNPMWSTVTMPDGKVVGAIELPVDSPGKPHKAKQGAAWVTFIRVGSTSRAATREEEARLYQAAQLVHYEAKAVPGTSLNDLDMDRIENYYRDVLKRSVPAQADINGWRQLLLNSDLLIEVGDDICVSVFGLLLFGENPNRRLHQAGVTAAAFPDLEKDYNAIDEERIRGPLTSRVSKRGKALEKGVIDRTVDFVTRNMGSVAWLESGRRRRKRALPVDAVREAIVNAVVHRDYARNMTDIAVFLYKDRLEIISPGGLPNGVTVEKMKEGIVRVARNEMLKEILRDYRYIEHYGMGVRNRIIKSMREHNGTEPDLVEADDRDSFTVRLWKKQ